MAVLSVPSYLIPGTYLENIRFIDRIKSVENIELLFFLFDDETESLLLKELPGIADYSSRFSYSVHMPDKLDKDHRRLLDILRPIADRFVVHAPEPSDIRFPERLAEWTAAYGDVFLVENVVGRGIDTTAVMVDPARLCCDTGHLLLEGKRPVEFFHRWEGRIGEIHIHGIMDGKDHHPFGGDEQWFVDLLPYIKDFAGIIHAEIFDYKKVMPVIDLLKDVRQ